MSFFYTVLSALSLKNKPTENMYWIFLLVRQMGTPVSSMKVAVHRRSPRLELAGYGSGTTRIIYYMTTFDHFANGIPLLKWLYIKYQHKYLEMTEDLF